MTARKPGGYVNSLERVARDVLAEPEKEPKNEQEWSLYPRLAEALQKKMRRAGLAKPLGGLARWHNGHREP